MVKQTPAPNAVFTSGRLSVTSETPPLCVSFNPVDQAVIFQDLAGTKPSCAEEISGRDPGSYLVQPPRSASANEPNLFLVFFFNSTFTMVR